MTAIRRILLPGDSNHHGKVFGGAILAELDLAGAIIAGSKTSLPLVTRAFHNIEFVKPLEVGHIMTISGFIDTVGNTSITVNLTIEGQKTLSNESYEVGYALVTYVAIGKDGKPTKIE